MEGIPVTVFFSLNENIVYVLYRALCFTGLPDVMWNSPENLERLHNCITALKLPPPPPAAVDGEKISFSISCSFLYFSLGEYQF